MNRAFWAALLVALLLVTGGCKKSDDKEAIRAGVVKHISAMSGLNVNNMDIVVTQATVSGSTAQANVNIRAKNGDPNAPPMQLVYNLQKKGNEWVVTKSEAGGGMQHPAPGSMPQGNLPPGHPSTSGGASGQTHDFNSILNSAQPQPNQQQPSTQQQQKPSSNPKP